MHSHPSTFAKCLTLADTFWNRSDLVNTVCSRRSFRKWHPSYNFRHLMNKKYFAVFLPNQLCRYTISPWRTDRIHIPLLTQSWYWHRTNVCYRTMAPTYSIATGLHSARTPGCTSTKRWSDLVLDCIEIGHRVCDSFCYLWFCFLRCEIDLSCIRQLHASQEIPNSDTFFPLEHSDAQLPDAQPYPYNDYLAVPCWQYQSPMYNHS